MDYDINLKKLSEYPKYYLGQEVNTPEGKGIIISLCMPSNGLYLSPERSTAVIWYGTNMDKTSWVQLSYSLGELNEHNKKEHHGQ